MNTSTAFGAIAFVEWHDAAIDSISIPFSTDQPSFIRFEHLAVYHQGAGDVFEIWSYRATLNIIGVRRVAIDGGYGESDYVSEARLYCKGVPFSEDRFLPGIQLPVDQLEVLCGSGRTVKIHCRELKLELGDPVEHIEDWNGPLR